MAYDKIEYNANYTKTKYDTFNVRVPKGYKEEIVNFLKACEYPSLNAYITTLIRNDMNIVSKRLSSLSGDEQFIVNCYRYANEEQKERMTHLACEIDNRLTREEKEKLFDLRRRKIELEVEKEWLEDFGQEKLPPYYTE